MVQIFKWKEKRSCTSVTKFNINLAKCFGTPRSAYCCPGAGSCSLCKARFFLRLWRKWLPSLSIRRTKMENTTPTSRTHKRGSTAFRSTLRNAVSSCGVGFLNVLLRIRRKIPDFLAERNLKKKGGGKNITCYVLWADSKMASLREPANYWLAQYVDGWLINRLTAWLSIWIIE